ncbi:MAG: type 2 isopentenyl-diphosphate Delta-isomerase [Endozoicomonadaceae bacterium]|nr:type 2 isopentenyl-diphosphate Delta-isomerase [Endozoicomonadaceae bacterium]
MLEGNAEEGVLTNRRKVEHIRVVEQDGATDRDGGYFDRIRLSHRGLPELSLTDTDTSVEFLGKTLSFPMLISSMTGGDHDLVRTINRNLAIAAQATGVAMGVGSQRVMLEQSAARASFELREFAPDALLFANLGAVQLNYGCGLEQCREAVAILEADALYLHLNPLQESVQPEGNTDFSGLLDKIAQVNEQLSCPVVLKEVGCGLSPDDIAAAVVRGIAYIDVAGLGGTSWSRIEHHRSTDSGGDIGLLFQDWGIPTPQALKLAAPFRDRVELIASGGLRNGIDMVKSVILGARLCGLAAPLLKPAMKSANHVISVIETLKREFSTAMFLLGIPNVATLYGNEALILDDRF